MKKFKFKLFILSAILLTLSSGLLFYRTLFLNEVNNSNGKNNFEELRYLDLKVNEQMALERRHLSTNIDEIDKDLNIAQNNIHDIIAIVLDLHLKNPAIKNSISRIDNYFKDKTEKINKFQIAIKELRAAVLSLHPNYRDIQNKKLKFTVEGRDFYHECIADAYIYLTIPSKDTENRIYEDKKILTQIIGIASKPEELVQRYFATLDSLITKNNEIEEILLQVKQKTIDDDIKFVNNYFRDTKNNQNDDGQFFLGLIFTAIIFYVFSIVVILRKF